MKIKQYYTLFSICVCFCCLVFPIVKAQESITLNPIADAYVSSSSSSGNYGGSDYLHTQFWNFSIGDDWRQNSYLLFDLSNITSDAFGIESATLELYHGFLLGATVQVGVHSCSSTDWNELELTWSNAPSFSPEPIDVQVVAFDDRWYSWDVTEDVQNSQGNYLTLVLSVENDGDTLDASFRSKDNFLGNPPRLVLNYTVIPEFSTVIMILSFITATLVVLIYKKRIWI